MENDFHDIKITWIEITWNKNLIKVKRDIDNPIYEVKIVVANKIFIYLDLC